MIVEPYLKSLPRASGPNQDRSTTLRTNSIDQGRNVNTFAADWASPASAHKQLQKDVVKDERCLSLTETFVKNPWNRTAKQRGTEIIKSRRRNILSTIWSDTLETVAKERTWCDHRIEVAWVCSGASRAHYATLNQRQLEEGYKKMEK